MENLSVALLGLSTHIDSGSVVRDFFRSEQRMQFCRPGNRRSTGLVCGN